MKKRDLYPVLALTVVVISIVAVGITGNAATITDGHPGYPNQWEGLTSNTIIEITLDTAVALVGGDPTAPDVDYCVKKATFSGLDFVFTDVTCAVEVSADRKTLKLYPTDLLGENELYAYKVNNINFEGGGSQQDVAEYFETGANPVAVLATQVNEADMCDDEGQSFDPHQIGFHCTRCHAEWVIRFPGAYGTCIINPNGF